MKKLILLLFIICYSGTNVVKSKDVKNIVSNNLAGFREDTIKYNDINGKVVVRKIKRKNKHYISLSSIIDKNTTNKVLGDSIASIIHNPDSVICNVVFTNTDTLPDNSKVKYNVSKRHGKISENLHSILQYFLISDNNFIDDSLIVKHQFEPELIFNFYKNKQILSVLYSPKSSSFGFGYKGSLQYKYFSSDKYIEKFLNDIKNVFNKNK